MNLFGLSPGELLLILMVAMIVLGPEKLPEVAGSLARWIREFRRATEELTAQFAGDNPLLELQRAFSLTDEPAPAQPAPEATPPPALEYTSSETSVATTMTAASPAPQIAEPVRHDYFTYPQTYPSISDAWTHGSLSEPVHRNGHLGLTDGRFISDEWTHGVPVMRPPEVVPDVAPPVAEPVPGVSALVNFEPASSTGSTDDDSAAPAQPTEDDSPNALQPATETDDGRSRLPVIPASEQAEVVAETPSPNGATEHHAEVVPESVSAVAGDGREGDPT